MYFPFAADVQRFVKGWSMNQESKALSIHQIRKSGLIELENTSGKEIPRTQLEDRNFKEGDDRNYDLSCVFKDLDDTAEAMEMTLHKSAASSRNL